VGRLYAEKAGLSVVCLRIGFFQDRPLEERHLPVWISPADMTQLVRCAVEARGIQYEVVYGVSNNSRSWWDLAHTRRVLGYNPSDDAEVYAKELLKDPPSAWLERIKWQGGSKADIPFMP
jgi:uronate dehydrogenase